SRFCSTSVEPDPQCELIEPLPSPILEPAKGWRPPMESALKPDRRKTPPNRRANFSPRHVGIGALLLAFYTSALPLRATAASRDVVQQIATLIENNYFDATQAQSIAKDLREASQNGRFDALADPR